ncbi:rod shape-determining protein MreD [Indiicoccus explosivorum]|uniref:rod shape-determining protein MreD n=1 Tax=Indiicoccus explosivorum TaxID=1917864 RepID=UPI000B4359C0|nr:rod shape-determining protein MreD [Indiicoccus explosivorum]
MNRILIPFICLVLFFIEPIFSLFSPFGPDGGLFIIPRFVLIFLMMTAIYTDRLHAVIWAFVFGVMHDVFFLDIIGLYALLFPVAVLAASFAAMRADEHPVVTSGIGFAVLLLFEVILYWVFSLIGFTDMAFGAFFTGRLLPTAAVNGLLMLALAFGLYSYEWKVRNSRYEIGSFR